MQVTEGRAIAKGMVCPALQPVAEATARETAVTVAVVAAMQVWPMRSRYRKNKFHEWLVSKERKQGMHTPWW